MKSKLIAVQIAVLVVCSFSACTNDSNPVDPNAPSRSYVSGVVHMKDEFANVMTDRSGVTITATNGIDTYSVTTNADGTWKMYNLPADVYTFEATKPDFNGLAHSGHSLLQNVQYVGSGAFTLVDLRLSKDLSSSMISNGSSALRYTYSYSESGNVIRTYTHIDLWFQSKHKGSWSYDVSVSDATTPTVCGEREASVGGAADPVNSLISCIEDHPVEERLYGAIVKKYGSNLAGRTIYLHVRPTFSKRTDHSEKSAPVCLEPLVIPVSF